MTTPNSSLTLSCLAALASCFGSLHAQTWTADFDVAAGDFANLRKLRRAQGFHLTSATARQSPNSGDRFELVWNEGTAARTEVVHGVDHATFQARLASLRGQGFRPVSIDTYGAFPAERYLALFVHDTVAWFARTRMTASEFQAEQGNQTGRNYGLVNVGASGTAGAARYSGVWTMPHTAAGAVHGKVLGDFRTEITRFKNQGKALASIATTRNTTAPEFAGVWIDSRRQTRELISLTLNQLRDAEFNLSLQGYRPIAVVGYETARGLPRYVSTWRKEQDMKVFSATGIRVPELAGFDAAMRSLMQGFNVTQATLAVTKDQRLVLARGYSNLPAGAKKTKPQSLSRIASLSKALTCVGILKLVQAGRIQLDQKVNTILDMRGWTDARVQDITVRQLMTHWGGWDRNISGDPIVKDREISNRLNKPLPTTPQMIFDFMKTEKLDHAPGTRFAYSNFGYEMQGYIIEKVTGMRLEDYMLREVFLPVGASSVRVTDSLRGDQIPGEIFYDDPVLVPSVMGPNSPPMVQRPYGFINLRSWAGAGAYVASAIDYARFLVTFDDKFTSPLLSAAMIDEIYKRPPYDTTTNPVYYGLGQAVALQAGGKMDTFHDGGLPGTATRMYRHQSGMNFVAYFNKRLSIAQIDTALIAAGNAVATWPKHDLFGSYASVRSFGDGCQGSDGVPYLRPLAGSLAQAGYPFTLELTRIGASPANVPFLTIGGSRTSWAGARLPLDLGPFGMPGCALHVSPDTLVPLANRGGAAHFSLDVPKSTSLVGVRVLMQGIVRDPSANALGFVTTAGTMIQVGMPH